MYYLFTGKERAIDGIDTVSGYIAKYDLPESDRAEFISGFLNIKLSEEQAKEFDQVKYGIKSLYTKNEVIVDSGETQSFPGKVTFNLLEDGFYYFQMSAAGGRGSNSPIYTERFYKNKNDYIQFWRQDFKGNTTENYQKKLKDLQKNNEENLSGNLTGINLGGGSTQEPELVTYTWERRKDNLEGYEIIWRGNYTYLNSTIYLSLVDFGYLDKVTNQYAPSGFNQDFEKEYGIMMIKKDITDLSPDGKEILKLVAFRSDDVDDDSYSKYQNGKIENGEFVPLPSTLVLAFNTIDFKGGDGQHYNGIIGITKGLIDFTIGRRALAVNSSGGGSEIEGSNSKITLSGGGTANINNFGGNGGAFVYDYYQRIIYYDTRPDDGHLNIRFLSPLGSLHYGITVTKDSKIDEISIPNTSPAGTIITLKTLILDRNYEIDFEESKITITKKTTEEYSLKDFSYKMYVGNFLEDVKTTITEPDYYSVQTITFPMPIGYVAIDLKTKKVKFKITFIADSRLIINHEIPEEMESGEQVSLNLEFVSNDWFINESVLIYYLAMKPEEVKFEKRNPDNTQIITFTMPPRNIIVRVKCDYCFILTFQLNERQEIEEQMERMDERKIKNVQVMYFSDIDGSPSEVRNITDFPDMTRVRPRTLFDVYVRFSDIKMTLDKGNIYSQHPSALIEEAGNFSPDTDGIPIRSPLQILPIEMKSEDRELYQHFRFIMPWNSLTLDLRWIERLYTLTIDLMELYFSNKKLLYFNDLIQRNSSLPRNVYPYAVSKQLIRADFELINTFCEIIEYNDSGYSFPPEAPATYVRIYESMSPELKKDIRSKEVKNLLGEDFDLYINGYHLSLNNFLMPKRDMYFFLSVKYLNDTTVLALTGFQSGTFTLFPGSYTIWFGGAKGGPGGGEGKGGEWGAGIRADLTVIDKVITLNYYLASDGSGGNAGSSGGTFTSGSSGSGGNGGGASYFTLNQPCEAVGDFPSKSSFRGAYMCGGDGGQGAASDGNFVGGNKKAGGTGGLGGGKLQKGTDSYKWNDLDSKGSGRNGDSGKAASGVTIPGFVTFGVRAAGQSNGGAGMGWPTTEIKKLIDDNNEIDDQDFISIRSLTEDDSPYITTGAHDKFVELGLIETESAWDDVKLNFMMQMVIDLYLEKIRKEVLDNGGTEEEAEEAAEAARIKYLMDLGEIPEADYYITGGYIIIHHNRAFRLDN